MDSKSEISDRTYNFIVWGGSILVVLLLDVTAAIMETHGWKFMLDDNKLSVLLALDGIIIPIFSSQLSSFHLKEKTYVSESFEKQARYIHRGLIWLLLISILLFLRPYPDFEKTLSGLRFSLYRLSNTSLVYILFFQCRNCLHLLKIKDDYAQN